MPKPLVSDVLWERIEPLLPKARRRNRHVQYAGRKRIEPRKVLNGIVFVLQTGVPWRALPATSDFPSGYTCRLWLLHGHRAGVWQRLQEELLTPVIETPSGYQICLGLDCSHEEADRFKSPGSPCQRPVDDP